MNNNKLQTLVNVMYNELTSMDRDGTYIKFYDTTKDEAFEVANTFVEAFPRFRDYRYLFFNTNKGYCLARIHTLGHEERYDARLMEDFAYISLSDALKDFNNIAHNDGYVNENGIHVQGDIDENDDDLDGGEFIGQYVGIFKEGNFYYIAGITKETPDEKDVVYPITYNSEEKKYMCDENVTIEQFKEKPLTNKKLRYNRNFDYKYNRGGFIIEEYVHKFNRTHYTQIVKFEEIDTSD